MKLLGDVRTTGCWVAVAGRGNQVGVFYGASRKPNHWMNGVIISIMRFVYIHSFFQTMGKSVDSAFWNVGVIMGFRLLVWTQRLSTKHVVRIEVGPICCMLTELHQDAR